MAFATLAKCRAGDDGDMLFQQQPLGEFFGGQAGACDTGKRIKRALRQMAVQAKIVQPGDNSGGADYTARPCHARRFRRL